MCSSDLVQLIEQHRPGPALGYVVITFVACLAAVWLGMTGMRLMAGRTESVTMPAEVEAVRR